MQCHKEFPESNQNVLKEGINFPLSYISRAIKWKNIDELQTYVNQIDTRMHHEFTIDKIYFC